MQPLSESHRDRPPHSRDPGCTTAPEKPPDPSLPSWKDQDSIGGAPSRPLRLLLLILQLLAEMPTIILNEKVHSYSVTAFETPSASLETEFLSSSLNINIYASHQQDKGCSVGSGGTTGEGWLSPSSQLTCRPRCPRYGGQPTDSGRCLLQSGLPVTQDRNLPVVVWGWGRGKVAGRGLHSPRPR